MECFNTLLLKLREVHEREVEGKWKFMSRVYLGGMRHNFNTSVKCFMAFGVNHIMFSLPGWQLKMQELSNKKGW